MAECLPDAAAWKMEAFVVNRRFVCWRGDEERAYYLSGRLPDQSIVVMDEEGRYYHVEKGHGKRYVACNRPSDRSEDFDEAVALLRRQADERVEKRLREGEVRV